MNGVKAASTPPTSEPSSKPRNTARNEAFFNTSQISVKRVRKWAGALSWSSRRCGISRRVPATQSRIASTITMAKVTLITG